MENDYLVHYGVKGMKWGVRRYQNEDGSLTPAGQRRYAKRGYAEDYHNSRTTGFGKFYDRTSNRNIRQAQVKYAKASDAERKARADKYISDNPNIIQKDVNNAKTAAIVGASVVAAGLLAYGGYRLYKSGGKVQGFVSNGKRIPLGKHTRPQLAKAKIASTAKSTAERATLAAQKAKTGITNTANKAKTGITNTANKAKTNFVATKNKAVNAIGEAKNEAKTRAAAAKEARTEARKAAELSKAEAQKVRDARFDYKKNAYKYSKEQKDAIIQEMETDIRLAETYNKLYQGGNANRAYDIVSGLLQDKFGRIAAAAVAGAAAYGGYNLVADNADERAASYMFPNPNSKK